MKPAPTPFQKQVAEINDILECAGYNVRLYNEESYIDRMVKTTLHWRWLENSQLQPITGPNSFGTASVWLQGIKVGLQMGLVQFDFPPDPDCTQCQGKGDCSCQIDYSATWRES